MHKLRSVLLLLLSGPLMATQMTHITAIYELQQSPHLELVEYALKVTADDYGPTTLHFAEPMSQGRVEQALRSGDLLQLAVLAPSPERENTLRAVYIPLSFGLLGYRVCLIHPANQSHFAKIFSRDDWIQAGLLIGQGAEWPDVEVLRANNLPVVTNPLPYLLFEMLRQNRFECYARGLNEIAQELTSPQAKGLVLEANLLLFYPQPALLFVAPNQPVLQARLQRGLELAWQDGFMQQHFSRHYSAIVQQLHCYPRRVITLDNPLLSEASLLAMKKFAYTPAQILLQATNRCVP